MSVTIESVSTAVPEEPIEELQSKKRSQKSHKKRSQRSHKSQKHRRQQHTHQKSR